MTKRASGKFDKRPRDSYDTPPEAVAPLLPYLAPATEFAEPCAGNGFLIDALEKAGHKCVWSTDIEPRRDDIGCLNALYLPKLGKINVRAKRVITNPPWTRAVMHPIIDRLSAVWPCFFLFDSDWAYTNQARDLLWRCARIIPVGRVKWVPGSKHVGFDNAAWYEFLPAHTAGPQFIPPGSPPAEAMMGPEERRRAEIRAAGALAEPGPLFDCLNGKGPSRAARAPSGPNPVSLLAKLRASAGRVGPIPKLTVDSLDKPDAAE